MRTGRAGPRLVPRLQGPPWWRSPDSARCPRGPFLAHCPRHLTGSPSSPPPRRAKSPLQGSRSVAWSHADSTSGPGTRAPPGAAEAPDQPSASRSRACRSSSSRVSSGGGPRSTVTTQSWHKSPRTTQESQSIHVVMSRRLAGTTDSPLRTGPWASVAVLDEHQPAWSTRERPTRPRTGARWKQWGRRAGAVPLEPAPPPARPHPRRRLRARPQPARASPPARSGSTTTQPGGLVSEVDGLPALTVR